MVTSNNPRSRTRKRERQQGQPCEERSRVLVRETWRVRRAVLVVFRDRNFFRLDRACRALRIATNLVGHKRLLEAVVGHESTRERVAKAEQELDGFDRLDGANDARQNAKHTGFGA